MPSAWPIVAARGAPSPTLRPADELVGREFELAVIRERLTLLPDEGSSLVIEGPAGIGKTSVLAAATEMARRAGAVVVEIAGTESETMAPFVGLERLLHPIASASTDLPLVQRRALSIALGQSIGPPPELFLTALATLTSIVNAAAETPIVIVADDVQWLDPATVQILAFVSRRVCDDPVVLLLGLRDGGEVVLDDIEARHLRLDGLDEHAACELLGRTNAALDPAARRVILAHAEGNPLALVELPRTWRSAHTTSVEAADDPVTLSARLEHAFADRMRELPAPTRDVLLLSAVAAEGDLIEILAAAAVLSGGASIASVLEPAEIAGLVRVHDGVVQFRHPLVRSALLGSTPADRRRSAHGALSKVLPARSYRSTWHEANSVEDRDDRVADDLDASHRINVQRGSVISAVAALERAAALTSDSGRRGRRLLRAADLAYTLGEADLVRRLVADAEAESLSDVDGARAEWLREIFTEGHLGDSTRVWRLCDLAANACDAGDADLALDLLHSAACRTFWASTESAARTRIVETVGRLTEHVDDPRSIATSALADPLGKGAHTSRRLQRIAGRDTLEPGALFHLGMAARACGEVPMAADLLDAAERAMRARGQLAVLTQVLTTQAAVHIDLGLFECSARGLEEARQLAADTGQPNWTTSTSAVRAVVAALTGDSDLAFDLAAAVDAASHEHRLHDFLALAGIARGVAHLSDGRHDAAYRELEPLFDPSGCRHHPREQYSALMFLAEAAAGCGRQAEAQALVDRVTEHSPTTSPLLRIHRLYACAVLADDDAAESFHCRALGHDLSRWPWPRARVQLAYGQWLRRTRRPVESREPLRAALAGFEAIGAAGWAGQARGALRASGDTGVVIAVPAVGAVLAARELQIARLAASGLSNREIGEQLYLSARTVGAYLYRIYPKLGVTSRTQLASRIGSP